MEQDQLILQAEEGASLSSGAIRLYALPYGCVDLYNYDPLNRRAAVGIMVATEYRRQGYALAMLRVLETQYYTLLVCRHCSHKHGEFQPLSKSGVHRVRPL